MVRLRLLPAHAGRPGGTVAPRNDHRGGPAGPECPRGAADRHREVALLPGPRPVGLRQDQRPHGRDLPAGGPDGRPAGRAGEARHNQRGQHQQPALDAGAQGRPRPDHARTGIAGDHLAGAAAVPIGKTGPAAAAHRSLGAGRGALPIQVGTRLPPRLPLHRPVHQGEPGRPEAAGALPDRHRQAGRQGRDTGVLPE